MTADCRSEWMLSRAGAATIRAMDVTDLLDPLNDAQRAAVTAEATNLLVLAGAGSGKTRVLTHRIAWYIATGETTPQGILAVTFTNKAAHEMRQRTERLLHRPVGDLWIGTFHGLAHRLLRRHAVEAGLPDAFQILDQEDQLRAVRRVHKTMGLDETEWPAKSTQWFINAQKEEGKRPQHVADYGDATTREQIRIYAAYEEACTRAGVVDFAELLLRAHELWRDRPELLDHYRRRFRHVLVDEFQDTNTLQYAWLRQLIGESGRLFAVGDDDQSIYSFRGARVENMQRFQKDLPGAEICRLEQNYRSTGNILAAANHLIGHNTARLGKELWTAGAPGAPIVLYRAYNEYDEARCVAGLIGELAAAGRTLSECAVLYRMSAQSRVIEDAFKEAGLAYRVHGGFRFYDRAEVKDTLAYLRLCQSREDDTAFDRVVNLPPRGIGLTTLERIREEARAAGLSLWAAAQALVERRALGGRAGAALLGFFQLIEHLAGEITPPPLPEGAASPPLPLPLPEILSSAIAGSGLKAHYRKDTTGRADDRIENLEELIEAARAFSPPPDEGLPPLTAFLAHASLGSGEAQAATDEPAVEVMTLHAAKGLEFAHVFLVGMEEEIFPHRRSVAEAVGLEEERRLCYVGITRAKEALYFSTADTRRLHGMDVYNPPSRFLREIPAQLLRELRRPEPSGGGAQRGAGVGWGRGVSFGGQRGRGGGTVGHTLAAAAGPQPGFPAGLALGQGVRHDSFGEGVVLQLEGSGANTRIQVRFAAAGEKWLIASMAKLEPLR
jgi:DNA helicase-2/ATP-dependent DNA helicase PcrA